MWFTLAGVLNRLLDNCYPLGEGEHSGRELGRVWGSSGGGLNSGSGWAVATSRPEGMRCEPGIQGRVIKEG